MYQNQKPLKRRSSTALLLCLGLMALFLSACGDSPTPVLPTATALPLAPTATPSPLPAPTATLAPTTVPASPTAAVLSPSPAPTISAQLKDVLQKAAAAYTNLNSLHFAIEVKAGKALIRGAEMREVSGDVKRGEGWQSLVKVNSFLGGTITVELVELNNEQFTTNPITGGWIKVSQNQFTKLNLLDAKEGLPGVLSNMRDLKEIGPETLDGEAVIHYQGTTDGKTIAPLTINALGKNDVTLDYWITPKDNLVRQLDLKEIGGDGSWTIKFSNFDKPVQIKKPNV